MLQSIWEDVKREFNYGNMVTRIIIVNVAVFVGISIINLILYLANGGEPSELANRIVRWLSMSSDWYFVLTHPWVIITSMFFHLGFFHILWNMLLLYWFGRIVGDFIGNQRVLPIYLLGGITGAIMFFISANVLPYGAGGPRMALGASAGVMAMVVAAGAIAPDYIMRLLFLGDVKLKYIVLGLLLLDLIGITNNSNTGGHFAHLGGALFGWVFIRQLQQGSDWSAPLNQILDGLLDFFRSFTAEGSSSRRGPKVVYRNPDSEKRKSYARKGQRASDEGGDLSHQDRLDTILDKIKQSGYDSLTEEEKEFLFNASKQ